jgi:hypothetical protein
MKISYTFCWHMGQQKSKSSEQKNQPNGKKGIILLVALSERIM